MASITAKPGKDETTLMEERIAILLEQRKLSSGEDTATINHELADLRERLKAAASSTPVLPISDASQTAVDELDELMSAFTKIRITAKSHRLRGSNATEQEKEEVEVELNATLDRMTIAKEKTRAHKAGYQAAMNAALDPYLVSRSVGDGGGDDNKTVRTGISHDTTGVMRLHRNPHDKSHPECPGRLVSIMEAVHATGLYDKCIDILGRKATEEELRTVHGAEHIEEVEKLRHAEHRQRSKDAYGKASVYANEHTTDAAYLSCGASLSMTEAVLSGKVQNGLVVARPPGHHAEPCQCMGFCIFNNVAVAAACALRDDKVQKVLIVDWDVHHGNGTQRMFYDNPNVMYVSIHRYDNGSFYPPSKDGGPHMVGEKGAAMGTNLNVGWNSKRVGDSDYLAAFDYAIMPACREFGPDLIYVSAGFDAARGDPLGGCDVTPSGYGQMLHQLSSLAGGKVIVVLEGGYNLRSIAASTVACLNVLVGGAPSRTDRTTDSHANSTKLRTAPSKAAIQSITATIAAHRDLACAEWACRFPVLGGGEKEEEVEAGEELLNQPDKETAEQLGKKMHMRAMFERMRAKRAARQQQQEGKEENQEESKTGDPGRRV